MRYEEKIQRMIDTHRSIIAKLESMARLPGNVDKKKLERAYDEIENDYVWVLTKRMHATV